MTNTEIIQAIRNEIIRLKGQLIRGACAAQIEMETNCKERAYDEVLSFLSTLESEKPMNQDEELNEEIKKFIEEYGYERGGDKLLIAIVARHFAQWQAEQDTRDMFMSDNRHFNKVYELGKKDMEKQMMKEAVEAKIYGYDDGSFELIASWLDMPNNSIYKDGDRVRIIICKKED